MRYSLSVAKRRVGIWTTGCRRSANSKAATIRRGQRNNHGAFVRTKPQILVAMSRFAKMIINELQNND